MLTRQAIFLMVLAFVSFQCKRQVPSQQAVIKRDSTVKTITEVKEVRFEPQYMTTRVKFSYQDPGQNLNGSASIRIVRDSAVWVSVSALFGIEAARVLFTQSYIDFANKLEGQKERYTYRQLSDMVGTELNLNMVEAILLGNKPKVKLPLTDQQTVQDTIWQRYGAGTITCGLLASNQKLAALDAFNRRDTTRCIIRYKQFEPTTAGLLAKTKFVTVSKPIGKLEVKLEHTRIEFPTERPEMPW